jgi:hypothetical protein
MNSQDAQRLQQLEDQQDARVCISNYMRLCDQLETPATVRAIGALFTTNACWEGVGEPYATRLGRHVGRNAIESMMAGYVKTPAHFAMNAHFLCSEALIQQPDGLLFGRWLMLQTSSFYRRRIASQCGGTERGVSPRSRCDANAPFHDAQSVQQASGSLARRRCAACT